ncbi:MAG: NADH-quinone oxidoreductase subunit J [Gammaproteobacteria bacterium]|nr:NADH-quinone oxidoreductase subunit J [Gammaproteobacteria bacterium]
MSMTVQQFIFYVFSGLTVFGALMIVTQSNPVRSVLFLVFSFLCSAVVWLLVQSEFLALILVLVYVGAVMTLFLFVVMMLNIDVEVMKTRVLRFLPLGLMLAAGLVGLLFMAVPAGTFGDPATPVAHSTYSNTQAIGMVLYTHHMLAFEIAAVILLVAIVAAITLAHRSVSPRSKRQSIVDQIMVQSADRLTMVNMRKETSKE